MPQRQYASFLTTADREFDAALDAEYTAVESAVIQFRPALLQQKPALFQPGPAAAGPVATADGGQRQLQR